MSDDDVLAYVRAAAALLAVPLAAERARAVASHLGRTAAMASLLDTADLAPEHELAEIFRPAPFPADEGEA